MKKCNESYASAMTSQGKIGFSLLFGFGLLLALPAYAQDEEVPYWASITAEVVNMRVGPSTTYRIDWVYRRKDLPLKVLRRKEGWRLVEDPDGAKGWMLGRFLSRKRTAYVAGEGHAEMRDQSGREGRLMWKLEPGVTVILDECEGNWCEVEVGGRKGYVAQARLWGAGAP